MRVSDRWLKEFVNFDLDSQTLASQLTLAGIEVSAVRYLGAGLENVIVGEITTCVPHPNAEKLHICGVNTGSTVVPVVCGAPNSRVGVKSAFVPPGVTLPGGQTVTEASIRGVVSQGMLCSERELGLSHDHSGIMELPEQLPVGQAFIAALGLDDYSLELELTTNRADCLSHLGVAREVATITNRPFQLKTKTVIETDPDVHSLAKVTIQDPSGCPRYCARLIRGVTIGPSPLWLQQRLWAIGQRPINNVVDVTNYVLMELGHPLHAFDYARIKGHHIIVRFAREGEFFTTLDQKEHRLTPDVLLIADEGGGVAAGGIMGGLHSEVTAETKDILLESAYFDPATIRRGSRCLNLRTEASNRFEKGTDIENVVRAINHAAQLIADVAGGQVMRGIIDAYPRPQAQRTIPFRPAQIKRVAGIDVPLDLAARFLTSLGFEITPESAEKWLVKIPFIRHDVTQDVDLIEDIIRHYGYDKIPERVCFVADSAGSGAAAKENVKVAVKNTLLGLGYSEVVSNSFVDATIFDKQPQWGFGSNDPRLVQILNPLSAEHNRMRPSLLVTILARVEANIRHKISNLKVFEFGCIFQATQPSELPLEKEILGILLTGDTLPASWGRVAKESTFFDLKGVIEDIFAVLNLKDFQFVSTQRPYLATGQAAEIQFGGQLVGLIGAVQPTLGQVYEIDKTVFWCELELEQLLKNCRNDKIYKALPKFPAVERDVALVMDEKMAMQPVFDLMQLNGGLYLESIRLFDVYQGAPLPAAKKSMAFALSFRSSHQTLTDDVVDQAINGMLQILHEKYQITLRS